MRLHELKPAPGSRRPKTRVGRGIAAGKGKTAGRGTKGQWARNRVRPGFEGGQNPLYLRLGRKRGFKNPFKIVFEVVNVGRLNDLPVEGVITPGVLRAYRLVREEGAPVKILGDGEVTRPLHVRAHAFSESARQKILAAGGTVEVIR
ncbi:50S ribosomal protein L15 [Thermomicrobium sp. 4228-Ro]|uniref:50S ribosomal protein L15 n=1 Tax=Thermomicrobium sp. 4228-Ro TaxID=2993937 RepID=UPI00224905AE|nr:50S ribosomal protein L15 [Thermomicrobium sp. 4228-Ro]MCX2725914.1 50S ribosomal protein L15 [Thermomicrobium sp. 4228-Ro]